LAHSLRLLTDVDGGFGGEGEHLGQSADLCIVVVCQDYVLDVTPTHPDAE